jgi:hypothetical protein
LRHNVGKISFFIMLMNLFGTQFDAVWENKKNLLLLSLAN